MLFLSFVERWLFLAFWVYLIHAVILKRHIFFDRSIFGLTVIILGLAIIGVLSYFLSELVSFYLIRQFWGRVLHDWFFSSAALGFSGPGDIPSFCFSSIGGSSESYPSRLTTGMYHQYMQCQGTQAGLDAGSLVSSHCVINRHRISRGHCNIARDANSEYVLTL